MQRLHPTLEHVSAEYVLVQAWKKASAYIRYHNWFSDTLELDRAAANLPEFISGLSEQLRTGNYDTSPLKLVPAPKSQAWHIDENEHWRPRAKQTPKIRPLAHVSLEDQVVATALLLCLSERVETAQGDPRVDFQKPEMRGSVMSYGNRLFCDNSPGKKGLVHRWGSSKLYRAYFEDYRTFLKRPEAVASKVGGNYVIFQTDLKQFYDRVTPELLNEKIRKLQRRGEDDGFFDLAGQVLNWQWQHADRKAYQQYSSQSEIPDATGIALPQGLVAAGFLSNIVLLDFDNAVLSKVGEEIAEGIVLSDACRYVDDIRLTLTLTDDMEPDEAQDLVVEWLEEELGETGPGLKISPDKTSTATVGGEQAPLVRQSRKMERIQSAISGGFDASGGEEVIQAIEALVRTQMNLNRDDGLSATSSLRAVPDVKDETIGRFAAGRFRKTFRSLRPLLDDQPFMETAIRGEVPFRRARLSQSELDDEAHAFALSLVERWVLDPSNVRLLRVALDLWPSSGLLEKVLNLFEPYLAGERRDVNSKRIVHYCLAEILRAGATETGFVEDPECLPANVDLDAYRRHLLQMAVRIVKDEVVTPPWYLVQQALLFVAVHNPNAVRKPEGASLNGEYWKLLFFLRGMHENRTDQNFAILAVVARRSFLAKDQAVKLIANALTEERFAEIAARDIEFARDLYDHLNLTIPVSAAISEDLGTTPSRHKTSLTPLRSWIEGNGPLSPLRNEIGILSFAVKFLELIEQGKSFTVVTPSTTYLETEKLSSYARVTKLQMWPAKQAQGYVSIYSAPTWAPKHERWRFQLGYLLRYILTAQADFSLPRRAPSWKESKPLYRPTRAHWFQRRYGHYNGHEAFGDDWLPISQFTQDLLFTLLAWPGCRLAKLREPLSLEETLAKVRDALSEAERSVGEATGTLMLKIDAPMPGTRVQGRPLRACVVQSIMPEASDFSKTDLEMRTPSLRRKHRKHLSTALAAVEKMLDLRETHKPANKRLDWLILPELSVHPDDVETHLVPFARAFKTAILAGMVYERLVPGQPLVNSALWIIPSVIADRGLQTIKRRQGKAHLSPLETPFNSPVTQLQGFRPCQWLIGYEWSVSEADEPLWLTGSICYDATDLKLASDLRDRSDVFAIPALNLDVGTFDQMAQALHYHMYQLVLIANNGTYGGSNAHIPKGEAYHRQVFHTHGQPQATISFFEIDDIKDVKDRRAKGLNGSGKWKHPPAGY